MKRRLLSILLVIAIALTLCPSAFAAPSAAAPKADVVFVIDSTGSMGDEIRNVIENVNSFASYLESLGVDLRMATVDYKDITVLGEEESTVVHLRNHSPWSYTAEQVAETLEAIDVTGGGDEPETLIDALGCVLSDDTMKFRSDASKFAVILTDADYKTDNNYGYSNMAGIVDAMVRKSIYASVIAPNRYKSYYADLYDGTEGIFADINSDFDEILKQFADSIFGISTSEKKAIYVLPGYLGSKLYDAAGNEIWLNEDNYDTIIDDILSHTLPGGEKSKIVRNEDGSGGHVSVDMSKDSYGTWNTYKTLIETLKAQCGEEYDVIFYPYNWLGDLNDSAKSLKNHITNNGYEKVVFVTHSTGGLLASNFIGRDKENKRLVEKALLIAAPLYGTYSALLPVETGEYQGLISDAIATALADCWGVIQDVAYAAAKNWVKAITKNSPTTYQLLPNENYLKLMATLYMEDKTHAVTTASEYYKVLNRSDNINDKLTNGNNRSHKYFRDTVLDGDIVSVLQEVDTYLIGSNYGKDTPAIAEYKTNIFGTAKLDGILYRKEGDGTVLGVSACAADSKGNASLNYKNFKNVDHTALVSNTKVLNYVCNTINGVSAYETSMELYDMADAGMSDKIRVNVTADQKFDIKVYDQAGICVAASTEAEHTGWDDETLIFNTLRNEEGDYAVQVYMPKTGYEIACSYGSEANTPISATMYVSTLDFEGNKTAIADKAATATGAAGSLFSLDATTTDVTVSTLEAVTGDSSVDTYDTDWSINDAMALDRIGTRANVAVTSSGVKAADLIWSSSDESVATVDASGVVTAVGYGKATITALQDGSMKTEGCTVTVTRMARSVQFENLRMIVDEKVKIKPIFDAEDVTETDVVYTVEDNGVISIDEEGVVTALTTGTTTVTGVAPGGATNTFKVTVNQSSNIAVESVSLSIGKVKVGVDKQVSIEASVEPADATNANVQWHVEDETVATIAATGLTCQITGISNGTTKVTVVSLDGGYTAVCEVEVSDADDSDSSDPDDSAGSGGSGGSGSGSGSGEGSGSTTTTTPALGQLLPILGGAAGAESFGFTDVKETDWFYDEVKEAWENDLIDGVTATEYRPEETLTRAQAIKLAAALNQMYFEGEVTLTNGSVNWYDTYVAYAVKKGIIDAKYAAYSLAQMNEAISRSEFVAIFAGALEEGCFEGWNSVADNAIPDVKMDDANAEAIYKFYRAGILTGSDAAGTFNPESSIKRSEVAAILIRMYDEGARQSISLG